MLTYRHRDLDALIRQVAAVRRDVNASIACRYVYGSTRDALPLLDALENVLGCLDIALDALRRIAASEDSTNG